MRTADFAAARRFLHGLVCDALDLLPPSLSIPLYYRWRSGRWPKTPPQTFSEKTQASKLRPVTREMVRLADKVAVKEVVRERLGPDWVVPTLFSGARLPPPERRDWPTPFVVKASHGSGWNTFVTAAPNWPRIEAELDRALARKPYRFRGEMHYRLISPQVIVEPMLGGGEIPLDFKIYVFGGAAHFVQVDTGRYTQHRRAFFDREWRRLPITRGYPEEPGDVREPVSLARMLEAAERMARGFDFLRVDFYEIAGHPYFGEATFFPDSAIQFFEPPEYERIFGDAWPWRGETDG